MVFEAEGLSFQGLVGLGTLGIGVLRVEFQDLFEAWGYGCFW